MLPGKRGHPHQILGLSRGIAVIVPHALQVEGWVNDEVDGGPRGQAGVPPPSAQTSPRPGGEAGLLSPFGRLIVGPHARVRADLLEREEAKRTDEREGHGVTRAPRAPRSLDRRGAGRDHAAARPLRWRSKSGGRSRVISLYSYYKVT
eukprot:scaffold136263_cov40-Tisochrysis_lutea.AAC.1